MSYFDRFPSYKTKTIFLFITVMLLTGAVAYGSNVFASEESGFSEVTLSADKTIVAPGETFTVVSSIKTGTRTNNISLGAIAIPGLEHFSVVGSYNQTQFESINGVSAMVNERSVSVVAQEEGTFTLGPVVIDQGNGTSTRSNVITITVTNKVPAAPSTAHANPINTSAGTFSGVGKGNTIHPLSGLGSQLFAMVPVASVYHGLLWLIILMLVGYIMYSSYIRTPVTPSDVSDTTDSDKPAMDIPGVTKNPAESPPSPLPQSPPSYDFASLNTIEDKSYMTKTLQELVKYLSFIVHKDVPKDAPPTDTIHTWLTEEELPTDTKEIIQEVLREYDVGKYAPYSKEQQQKVMQLIHRL